VQDLGASSPHQQSGVSQSRCRNIKTICPFEVKFAESASLLVGIWAEILGSAANTAFWPPPKDRSEPLQVSMHALEVDCLAFKVEILRHQRPDPLPQTARLTEWWVTLDAGHHRQDCDQAPVRSGKQAQFVT
jgi:hypothetical protein